MKMRLALLTSVAVCSANIAVADSLEQLADDFWARRAKCTPFTPDDVNRIERPGGIRGWSQASINQSRKDLAEFEARWKKLNPAQWPIPKQVDYKLVGSALSRVNWELDINPRWKRDPNFYIEQTLTALAEALTVPAPYDEARSREILTRIENIPSILQQGSENLENPPAPFANVAVQNLNGIRDRLRTMASTLVGSTTLKPHELNTATDRAAEALEKFQQQLKHKLPTLPQQTARQEAIAFSASPGGAMTYQIGKLQILKFLADARMQQGDKFNLRAFHDFVWKNGNLPIALQQSEYLSGI
jgi:uncharacterized protein (DUF885 family)